MVCYGKWLLADGMALQVRPLAKDLSAVPGSQAKVEEGTDTTESSSDHPLGTALCGIAPLSYL